MSDLRQPADTHPLRRAWVKGIAAGLEKHLPKGIGTIVRGGPICLILAFLHFVLGVDFSGSWPLGRFP